MSERNLQCPRCNRLMHEQAREGIAVDWCPGGCGIWLDDGEIGAAAQNTTEPRSDAEREAANAASAAVGTRDIPDSGAACPICTIDMAERVYGMDSSVIIDVCTNHGIWVDNGELEQIEAWSEYRDSVASADIAEWSGEMQRLAAEQEARADREIADVHWGPFRWIATKVQSRDGATERLFDGLIG